MSLRFLTAGESHGPELTAILEGMPAGLPVDLDALSLSMARRQKGFGSGGRMRIERDAAIITAGVQKGRTTGAPIALTIRNRDFENWRDKDIAPMTIPRPGHADLSASLKYGYGDLRLALERASARETAARVAVGALCAQLLAAFDIEIGSYVVAIGDVEVRFDDRGDVPPNPEISRKRFMRAEADELRCPDPAASARMRASIQDAIRERDTLGGVFEVVVLGLPPGLGSHVHWDRRLSGRLIGALASIQAIKGVELGPAFENARRRGTQVHDRFVLEEGGAEAVDSGTSSNSSMSAASASAAVSEPEPEPEPELAPAPGDSRIRRAGGRGGGIEGGITTGEPLLLRAAMKPISTTLTPLDSVDLATGETAHTQYERSDFCAVPRAAVVGEAMVAYVLADALMEKLGGDSLQEMLPRFEALPRGRLADLPMDDEVWCFGYGLEGGRSAE